MATHNGFDPGVGMVPISTSRRRGASPGTRRLGSPYVPPSDPPNRGLQRDLRPRAAQYIRMSTDHQLCSPALQRDAIARYALEHDLEVVRTYADEGKSGLSVIGRQGLCELLQDVAGGRADFGVVLVYDVSRWGRFQDSDESAYYEYLCRRCGVRVEYCKEAFTNDGSPMSTVIKALKRIMAAEYSRELSQKTFAAKCRWTAMGYRQGGIAGYGLRRLVLDAAGKPRTLLEYGQAKCIQGDRVVLVPGPPEELKLLRWIFRQVARHRRTPTFIARTLNGRGVASPGDRPWTEQRVAAMLVNDKYIGNLVFNKCSTKLKTPRVRNPADQWVRADGAHAAVISPQLFQRAQVAMATWTTRISSETALGKLRSLLAREGRLSANLIDATSGMPGSGFYAHRFGGLYKAYSLAGFKPLRDWTFVDGYAQRRRRLGAFRAEVLGGLAERGATVVRESNVVAVVNGRRLAILLGWCKLIRHRPTWLIQLHLKPHPDWVLVARLNPDGAAIQDYCLLPGGSNAFKLGVRHRKPKERLFAATLAPLLGRIAGSAPATSSCQLPRS